MPVSVFLIELLKDLTDFNEAWYECYATESHSKLRESYFPEKVIGSNSSAGDLLIARSLPVQDTINT